MQKTCSCSNHHFETRLPGSVCSMESAVSCLLDPSLESFLILDRGERLSLARWRGSSGPAGLIDSVSNPGDD
jgi:hypothetical protein